MSILLFIFCQLSSLQGKVGFFGTTKSNVFWDEHLGVKPFCIKNPGVAMKKKGNLSFVDGKLSLKAILKDIPQIIEISVEFPKWTFSFFFYYYFSFYFFKMDSFKVTGNLEDTKMRCSTALMQSLMQSWNIFEQLLCTYHTLMIHLWWEIQASNSNMIL